ncbi:MAG TPA: metallophosphoesterase, partial [Solirubrobacteraceae bacterium]|nr:metallophosphoesterase [Solirubrobacteraceae bacterium]
MRSAVLSDSHLARLKGADLLLKPAPRTRLLQVLGDIDRLVILGDVLELRERRTSRAVALARPLFAELGKALPAEAEVVIVPGNHDY